MLTESTCTSSSQRKITISLFSFITKLSLENVDQSIFHYLSLACKFILKSSHWFIFLIYSVFLRRNLNGYISILKRKSRILIKTVFFTTVFVSIYRGKNIGLIYLTDSYSYINIHRFVCISRNLNNFRIKSFLKFGKVPSNYWLESSWFIKFQIIEDYSLYR